MVERTEIKLEFGSKLRPFDPALGPKTRSSTSALDTAGIEALKMMEKVSERALPASPMTIPSTKEESGYSDIEEGRPELTFTDQRRVFKASAVQYTRLPARGTLSTTYTTSPGAQPAFPTAPFALPR